nr:protein NRT1/ PTR FAMILY 8.1-like [Tanacetum cinerariifolium]GFA55922.1 protein NRT1/ PTR FAMILY 8.1-like [Tanacetum cinerariifolium]
MSDNTKKAQCIHCLHFFLEDSNSTLKNHISHLHCEALKRAAELGQSSMSRDESLFVYNPDVLREQFAGLVPAYFLIGCAEVFTMVGQIEFFYDQAPDSMRSLCSALALTTNSLGNYLSSLLVTIVMGITTKG